MFNVSVGSIGVFLTFANLVSWKRVIIKREMSKIWAPEVFSLCGVLLTGVSGQSEVIRCISDFLQLCISKMTGRRATLTKIWTPEVATKYVHVYRVGLSIRCSISVIQCISDFRKYYIVT